MPGFKRAQQKIKQKVFYIKSMQAQLEGVRALVSDPELAAKLDALIEQVRFSDPMSDESLKKVEGYIQMDVEELVNDVSGGHIEQAGERIRVISQRLGERNAQCKLLK